MKNDIYITEVDNEEGRLICNYPNCENVAEYEFINDRDWCIGRYCLHHAAKKEGFLLENPNNSLWFAYGVEEYIRLGGRVEE